MSICLFVICIAVAHNRFPRIPCPDLPDLRAVDNHEIRHEALHGRGNGPENAMRFLSVLPLPAAFQADGAVVRRLDFHCHQSIVIRQQVMRHPARIHPDIPGLPGFFIRLFAFVDQAGDIPFHSMLIVACIIVLPFVVLAELLKMTK